MLPQALRYWVTLTTRIPYPNVRLLGRGHFWRGESSLWLASMPLSRLSFSAPPNAFERELCENFAVDRVICGLHVERKFHAPWSRIVTK